MLYAFKRLALGIGLIALASAILLLSDRGHRTAAKHAVLRLAIVQHANTAVLDDGVRGVIEGLSARGFHDGDLSDLDCCRALDSDAWGWRRPLARHVHRRGAG